MGCDIHMVVERKVSGRWIAVKTLDSGSATARERNYERFAKLAGVRGDGPQARGLPEGLGETTKYLSDEWGNDGHSHSWLPIMDAAQIFAATQWFGADGRMAGLTGGMGKEYVAKYPASYYFGIDSIDPAEFDNYRLVFWFDN